MTHPILKSLKQGTVLLDGGMATSLQAQGLEIGSSPELWNLERPEIVQGVHEGFLRAGSDVIQSNSFGANAIALDRRHLKRRLVTINRSAARSAKRAVETVGRGIVAGSVGPTGEYFDGSDGAVDLSVKDAFAPQVVALVEGGVDYFALETFSNTEEALCAVEAVRENSDLPFTVSFTFEETEDGYRTPSGDSLAYAALSVAAEGACAVGFNCSIGSSAMLAALPALLEVQELPLIAKPNAGLPELANGKPQYLQEPEDFAQDMSQLATLGVRAVGGCCGCDEAFIAALAKSLGRG